MANLEPHDYGSGSRPIVGEIPGEGILGIEDYLVVIPNYRDPRIPYVRFVLSIDHFHCLQVLTLVRYVYLKTKIVIIKS